MKKAFLLGLFGSLSAIVHADVDVKNFRYAGPFALTRPVLIDSLDVQSKSFSSSALLQTPLQLNLAQKGKIVSDGIAPGASSPYALHLLQFSVHSTAYRNIGIEVKGLKNYSVYVDDAPLWGTNVTLLPKTYRVVIKYLSEQGVTDSLRVRLTNADSTLQVSTDTKRTLTLSDIQDGRQCYGVSLSPNGRYLISGYYDIAGPRNTRYFWRLIDLKTGNILRESNETMAWWPGSDRYYSRKTEGGRSTYITTDLLTGKTDTVARNVPEGTVRISPKGDYFILTTSQEGPKKGGDIYEIRSPEDRQYYGRTRSNLSFYDLKTGLVRPLTFGHHNVSLQSISQDGRYILYMVSKSRLTQRPTSLFSLYRLDLQTMQTDSIVEDDGFLAGAQFSPDANQVLVKASAEAFNSIGKNLPEGRTPNMFDYQLYTVDIATKAVTPLTRNFDPSIEDYFWNAFDRQIYFTALDKDKRALFHLQPSTGRFTRIKVPEDYVAYISFAREAPLAAWYGESASNSDRIYTLQLRNGKSTLFEDLSVRKLQDVTLGKCQPWNFVSSRGDTIFGRSYLPPDFDPTKKYPMIVYYYGGCMPVNSIFESNYPLHLYAAQGYVVYVVNPSGAAGFGQEYASRHVNTAGKGVADDIIEGTKAFLVAHPYVDAKRVGCIGASYGGFMTQYLQTQTDIFAAAISHAGISDHSSYWGEGYWGYSYSEVSMANSYPWANKELYVDQSPLFNADKIHTPLLFLHGNADTNVPIGESIQMFTALKLLGRPTAFVVVNGEDHAIQDYEKRVKWQNTIFAWFARYLQGDASWWNALYPAPTL